MSLVMAKSMVGLTHAVAPPAASAGQSWQTHLAGNVGGDNVFFAIKMCHSCATRVHLAWLLFFLKSANPCRHDWHEAIRMMVDDEPEGEDAPAWPRRPCWVPGHVFMQRLVVVRLPHWPRKLLVAPRHCTQTMLHRVCLLAHVFPTCAAHGNNTVLRAAYRENTSLRYVEVQTPLLSMLAHDVL